MSDTIEQSHTADAGVAEEDRRHDQGITSQHGRRFEAPAIDRPVVIVARRHWPPPVVDAARREQSHCHEGGYRLGSGESSAAG